MGLGQQEELYGCPDVSIGNNDEVSATSSTDFTTTTSTTERTSAITTTPPTSTIEESGVILYPGKFLCFKPQAIDLV